MLIPGFLIVAGFSCGIFHLKITTDPVDLWAANNSMSRIDKRYFDETFGPFYRIEHIFITAKNLPSVHHHTADGDESFGPIFNKMFMKKVYELQTAIENVSWICFLKTILTDLPCFWFQ